MKKNSIIYKVGIAAIALLTAQACTDLDERTYNVIREEEFGKNPDQLAALIGPLYGGLGDYYGQFTGLNAVTDEQIVPTRGGDWKDGDQWKRYEMHEWDPVLDDGAFNGMWGWIYGQCASINQQIVNPAISGDKRTYAELRTLRAFYHYLALDNFGRAIIVVEQKAGEESTGLPKQRTRKEMFDFVEKELTESLPDLSEVPGGFNYGRMTQWVAHMILAKMYLNAQVWIGEDRFAAAWSECNTIITSNKFDLSNNFFDNFSINNQSSPETILATPMDKTKRTGFNIQYATLHYKHQLTYDLGGSPWNGYSAATEFYNSFETADVRKQMWIVGQQYDIFGNPLDDDALPMIIDPVIPQFEMAAGPVGRLKGARSQKYEIQVHNKTSGNSQDNDFIIFRLADVYLMRGEASFRRGNPGAAADDFNYIRSRRGSGGTMLELFDASITEADMLAERGREMAWEYHRRQDQIRFGVFDDAYGFKPATTDHSVYPIPQTQINLNPNLTQNEQYVN